MKTVNQMKMKLREKLMLRKSNENSKKAMRLRSLTLDKAAGPKNSNKN